MSIRIAAVMMVRNEAAIVADSIANLLHGVGVDAVLVADNGSTDATPAILRRIAAQDARVRVRSAPGAYDQPAIVAGLIADAVAGGADWVLPTDADEFHWFRADPRASLSDARGIGAFLLPVRNFAQLRVRERDGPGAIETMCFSARPIGSMDIARAAVCNGSLPFLRIPYPAKLILRAAPSLQLTRGQHGALGIVGAIVDADFCELLHAPIRSRDDLGTRVEHGRRLLEVAPDPDVGWHLKRLVGMDRAALDAEWRANSIGLDALVGAGFAVDFRLSRLGHAGRAFRRAIGPFAPGLPRIRLMRSPGRSTTAADEWSEVNAPSGLAIGAEAFRLG